MRFVTALVFMAIGFSASASNWKRHAEVANVAVEVSIVSRLDMLELRRKYGLQGADSRQEGLSILFTNKETGARRCEVYVVMQPTPTKMTELLGHELTHCLGYQHDDE